MKNKLNTEKSRQLFEETKQYLVNGVASSFHKAPMEEYPICISHGKGSRLYDVDGNEYIDYVQGFGPVILGHSPEAVNRAVAAQLEKGSQFSATTEDLCRLAKKLTEIIPCAELVSFQSTGTEANMHAFRVARAYKGRMKIVKFEGQYHGWSDEQKITISTNAVGNLGPRKRPWKLLGSAGQPEDAGNNLIMAPWNDIETLKLIFEREGSDIAAVIMEPYMCDEGPIEPLPGYLQAVKDLAESYGSLLIFDEVITGFRMSLGGAQQYYGVKPHMSVFAKAIASGYSISMVCGRKDVMSCGVNPSGTFNANPIAVAAALATISELEKPGVYDRLQQLSELMAKGIKKLADKHGLKVYTAAHGAICQLEMGIDRAPVDFRDVLANTDSDLYDELFVKARDYGVRLSASRGRIYLSTAHTEDDIAETMEVFDQIFSEIK